MKPNISELIRQKRGERTLREAAAEIGISVMTLKKLESDYKPSARIDTLVARWLNTKTAKSLPTHQVEALARQAERVERELMTLRQMIIALLD